MLNHGNSTDILDPHLIIDNLQGAANLDQLSFYVYKNMSHVDSNNHLNDNTNPNNIDYDEMDLEDDSHSSIIKKQQMELNQLERQESEKIKAKKREEEDKFRKAKEEQQRIEREKKEEREKIEREKIEEKLKLEKLSKKKNLLPEEPQSGDPESTLMVFRYPDGEGRAERRFSKKNKVKDLYTYIESLENQTFNEEGKFELIQPFPFKAYKDKEKTLEEEKLFPNAVIQIREI